MSEKTNLLQWDNKLSTGITAIDNQHQKLLSKINGVLEAIAQGRSETVRM